MDDSATLDVIDGGYNAVYDSDEEESTAEMWGRCFPIGKGFTAQELVKDEYTFGRDSSCDHSFNVSAKKSVHFAAISKVHFRIFRVKEKSNTSKYNVFLEDKSSNGTFVNGEKVGRGKKRVLNNNDEIALSLAKNKAFIFCDCGQGSPDTSKLPEEFREKYTLSKTIGRGACGEVKLAFEKDSCRKFAVKVISKKTFSMGPKIGPAVMDEVKILKSMRHPCIIRIEDMYDTIDTLYIVLELVEGGELFDRIVKVGKFSEDIAKMLFYQMLLAVKYLHDRGITHRDLKPENVLLSSDSANETLIKVTDFGLSRVVGEHSLMKTLCGTPSYLAPEVLTSANKEGYGKAVDCWSLGVILFICLAGYPPFSDEIKEYSLHDQIVNARYTFPDEYWDSVSTDAKDLIQRLLTLDPKERITMEEAMRHKWLQDDEMKQKVQKLMDEEVKNLPSDMPPPALPLRKRPSSEDDSTTSSSKRSCLETPPPVSPNNSFSSLNSSTNSNTSS
ncbi:serine/threonine-protein kinase Chk2-like [Dysidea avara]|uniref:serine/threonine-protein kinase Chk2-like n=1 Tax=Dysidea avara TaxID=196820 RepID=UPI0033193AC3